MTEGIEGGQQILHLMRKLENLGAVQSSETPHVRMAQALLQSVDALESLGMGGLNTLESLNALGALKVPVRLVSEVNQDAVVNY